MKRGLITWDKSEISPEVFTRRIEGVRAVLRERGLPALVVYSELWRSNQARFFSNYMPYFNRALLIVPADHNPTLLCGLSPRVYGWIRSVTIIEDVRPAPNFVKPLSQLASERSWTRFGVLDFEQFPYDLHQALKGGPFEWVPVDADAVYQPVKDESERAMRAKAAEIAAEILEKEIPKGVGSIDYHFVGRLERQFRRLGAEDLIVLLSNGRRVPAPPAGERLEENFSVSIALEYRGHWVRVTRPHGSPELLSECRATFESSRQPALAGERAGKPLFVEDLGGSYPYECRPGLIWALQVELSHNGKRLFYGDTIL